MTWGLAAAAALLIAALAAVWLLRRAAPAPVPTLPDGWLGVAVDGVPRRALLLCGGSEAVGLRRPLLLAFHGGGGRPDLMAQRTGLVAAARAFDFALAFPEAAGRWGDGRDSVEAAWPNDLAFLARLAETLGADPTIDASRLFVVGQSNGAMLAQRIACEAGNMLRGAVSVNAALPEGYAGRAPPGPPVPILIVAGTDDPMIPFAGGPVREAGGLSAGGAVLSHAETVAFWRRRNRCAGAPARREGRLAGLPMNLAMWEAQSGGADVWSLTLVGGGHRWPRADAAAGPDGTDLETLVMEFLERQMHVLRLPAPPPSAEAGIPSTTPSLGTEQQETAKRWQ